MTVGQFWPMLGVTALARGPHGRASCTPRGGKHPQTREDDTRLRAKVRLGFEILFRTKPDPGPTSPFTPNQEPGSSEPTPLHPCTRPVGLGLVWASPGIDAIHANRHRNRVRHCCTGHATTHHRWPEEEDSHIKTRAVSPGRATCTLPPWASTAYEGLKRSTILVPAMETEKGMGCRKTKAVGLHIQAPPWQTARPLPPWAPTAG